MSDAALYTADRLIVANLKRIDPKLSVAFADPPGRWAVYYDVPFEGNSDAACEQIARALQAEYREKGYVVDWAECERQAHEKMQDHNLVCYVANDDGSFRPLDQRIVEKVARMDWNRRHLGLKEFKAILDVKADAARKQRERQKEDVWDCIRRDKAYGRMAHDILWGNAPARSIIVPDNFVRTQEASE